MREHHASTYECTEKSRTLIVGGILKLLELHLFTKLVFLEPDKGLADGDRVEKRTMSLFCMVLII